MISVQDELPRRQAPLSLANIQIIRKKNRFPMPCFHSITLGLAMFIFTAYILVWMLFLWCSRWSADFANIQTLEVEHEIGRFCDPKQFSRNLVLVFLSFGFQGEPFVGQLFCNLNWPREVFFYSRNIRDFEPDFRLLRACEIFSGRSFCRLKAVLRMSVE